ncbi:MAG: hypothetical protein ACLTMP_06200 [Eggerthella lenta]
MSLGTWPCSPRIALLLQNFAVAHVDPAPASLFLATESVFGVTFWCCSWRDPHRTAVRRVRPHLRRHRDQRIPPLRAEKKRRAAQTLPFGDDPERET